MLQVKTLGTLEVERCRVLQVALGYFLQWSGKICSCQVAHRPVETEEGGLRGLQSPRFAKFELLLIETNSDKVEMNLLLFAILLTRLRHVTPETDFYLCCIFYTVLFLSFTMQ